MRTFVVTLAVALFVWLGWSSPAPAQEVHTTFAGLLSAAEHEVEEGYFAVGQEMTLVAKPGSRLQDWLRGHNGQRIVIRIEPDPGTE